MSWTWTYDNPDDELPQGTFSSQSDAESWIGEAWRELLESGVHSVTLMHDGIPGYTMSLEPAE